MKYHHPQRAPILSGLQTITKQLRSLWSDSAVTTSILRLEPKDRGTRRPNRRRALSKTLTGPDFSRSVSLTLLVSRCPLNIVRVNTWRTLRGT
jgi:hypothetical protein